MKTKKHQVWVLLPKKLKEDLDRIEFEKPNHKNKAIKFIAKILRENSKDNFDSLRFRPFAKKYFIQSGYASRYHSEFMDLLVDNEIIERNDYFSKDSKICKSYRIQESYFSGIIEYTSTSYTTTSYSSDSICLSNVSLYPSVPYYWRKTDNTALQQSRVNISLTKIAQELGIQSYPFSQLLDKWRKKYSVCATYKTELKKDRIADMFDSLEIDYKKILAKTNEVVENISYNDFKIGSDVEGASFEVYNRKNAATKWMTKDGALTTAQKLGMTLIQDKDKYYIDDLDRYIETKKKNILVSYNTSVTALRKRIYSINRNNTNFRLDTVFTSMCSHTLDIIKKDNNLIEIDLVNSQYAIFANWLMTQDCYKETDVKKFCELAIQGGLYEYINEQLNLENRKQAKKIMMVVAFSSYRFNSSQKTQFKELFPNVYKFISDFNKSNDGRFAVCLQNKESRIFIDGLMNILINKGYFVITKHDSLIIKESDKDEVIKIVQDYFNAINFKASINVDNELIQNGVSDAQILDESIEQVKCQTVESEQEIGYLKQQLPKGIKVDKITPYDVSDRIYDHLEPFKYFGCTVQNRKYYLEVHKFDESEIEEIYIDQFKQIESLLTKTTA